MGIIETGGAILAFAIVQILRDWRDGKSIFKRNGTAESNKAIKQILDSQTRLREHFNDETTTVLKDIVRKLDDILVNGVRMRN